jgi:DNA-directed RNA polymerase subunit RPC12/RpoP
LRNIWKYSALILSNILVYIYLGENILFITVMISLVLDILIHISTHEYICNNCKHRFSIKFHKIISFHAGNYRKLKCPVCGAVTLAEEVNKYKNDT